MEVRVKKDRMEESAAGGLRVFTTSVTQCASYLIFVPPMFVFY